MLKACGLDLPPLEAFSSRTGRSRGKDLLGALSKDGHVHPGAKKVFIDSFLGKNPAGSCREGPPGVHLGAGPSMGLGAPSSPRRRFAVGAAGLCRMEEGFLGPCSALLPPVPSQDVLFKSLEALSLKRGQEPLVWPEAVGGSGLRSGQGPGGLYGWGIWGYFAHRFHASFLSAALLVEFASSPRKKSQVSQGVSSSLLRGVPVVVGDGLGWGAAAGGVLQSSRDIAVVGTPPCLVLVWEPLPDTILKHFGDDFGGTCLWRQQGFPIGRMP